MTRTYTYGDDDVYNGYCQHVGDIQSCSSISSQSTHAAKNVVWNNYTPVEIHGLQITVAQIFSDSAR